MATLPMRNWTNQKLTPYRRPDDFLSEAIRLTAAATGQTIQYSKGTVLALSTAVGPPIGQFEKYNTTGSNGTNVARCLLMYDCVVDDQGNITLTTTAGQSGDELGLKTRTVAAYFSGIFRCEDLVYLLAGTPTVGVTNGILTDLAGRINWGTVSVGEMQF